MEQQNYEKRGYLHEEFRLFHLYDPIDKPVDWHYHAFHKIIVFLAGKAGYGVEGKSYALQAGDLILIGKGCIHRPEVEEGENYERVIIYISPDFLRSISTPDCDMELCFTKATEDFDFVMRPMGEKRELMLLLKQLEHAMEDEGFGGRVLQRSIFLQMLITITRGMMQKKLRIVHTDACDEKILGMLRYIAEHLREPLSADALANQFYMSKFHMMRRFKEQTGYTIHNYVNSKRLIVAKELIANGASAQQACQSCGFRDYSAFARAYKKLFSALPSAEKR